MYTAVMPASEPTLIDIWSHLVPWRTNTHLRCGSFLWFSFHLRDVTQWVVKPREIAEIGLPVHRFPESEDMEQAFEIGYYGEKGYIDTAIPGFMKENGLHPAQIFCAFLCWDGGRTWTDYGWEYDANVCATAVSRQYLEPGVVLRRWERLQRLYVLSHREL